jgi:hypothetical protein
MTDAPMTLDDETENESVVSGEGSPRLDLAVLEHVRSYDALAEALGVDRAAARGALRTAVEEMVRVEPAPSAAMRGQIIDYLLGEQTFPERTQTRSALDRSDSDRAWANEARLNLALVMQTTLPSIPDPETDLGDGAGPTERPGPPPLALAGARVGRGGEVRSRGAAAGGWLWAIGTVVVACAVAVVVVVATGGHSPARRPATLTATRGGRADRRGGVRVVSRQIIARLTLTSAPAQPKASGEAVVVRQGSNLLLLLQARGLKPNDHTYYAVWLYNSEVDSELLGLVAPAVGPAGTFSSGTTLPDDAVRFHSVLITLEKGASPSDPGQQILSSPLSVP